MQASFNRMNVEERGQWEAAYEKRYADFMKKKAAGADIDDMDALSLAMEAGSPKAVNIVLMGRVSRYFPEISEEAWLASLEACVPPKFLEMNKKAFMLGRN